MVEMLFYWSGKHGGIGGFWCACGLVTIIMEVLVMFGSDSIGPGEKFIYVLTFIREVVCWND
jgi:hypothetical protein